MFTKTAVKITENMVRKSAIPPEDREIYVFGVQQGLVVALNVATMALIGVLLGVFWYMLPFAIAFVPLRSFAGGYHASTPVRCYVASTAMMVLMALMFRFVAFSNLLIFVLLLIFGALIMFFAPVGNKNKPLDDLEKIVYKNKAIIICIAEIIVAFAFLYFGIMFVTTGILWAQLVVLLLVVSEKVFVKPWVQYL